MQTLGVNKPLICSSEIEALNPLSLKKKPEYITSATLRAQFQSCAL